MTPSIRKRFKAVRSDSRGHRKGNRMKGVNCKDCGGDSKHSVGGVVVNNRFFLCGKCLVLRASENEKLKAEIERLQDNDKIRRLENEVEELKAKIEQYQHTIIQIYSLCEMKNVLKRRIAIKRACLNVVSDRLLQNGKG